MLGTERTENLPETEARIKVFAPVPEKAPSTPWMEREG